MSLKPFKSDQEHFWRCPEMHRKAQKLLGAKKANLILKSSRNVPKTSQIRPITLLEVPTEAHRVPETAWEVKKQI
jgi:hypothetical protein